MRIFALACCLLLLTVTGAPAQEGDVFGVNAALGLTTPAGQNSVAPATAPSPVPAVQLESAGTPVTPASDVFGANLFTGAFARQGATQFNPDYLIAIGDRIQVRLWGGFTFDSVLVVDPQGNVFLPQVGPVRVLGVRNQDLQQVVDSAMRQVFRANVFSYASLAEAQPVRIFVGGFVLRPGLYHGTSMDSLLHYLDQAGGIDPERGSFLQVQVKRGQQVRSEINLYDFLLQGQMPQVQLGDGDVIFVAPRRNVVKVSGLVDNAKRFEFSCEGLTVAELSQLAKPLPRATHVRVVRNTGTTRNTEYYPLEKTEAVALTNGDELEFTADKKIGTITVRVEGEHLSPQEYVLPHGAKLGELFAGIKYSEQSDSGSVQLFRQSVKERQKQMLATALKSLESSVLTARSGTSDEARLRKDEAELVLQWIERAKKIEPTGQVLVAAADNRKDFLLENGDIFRIPVKDNLVLVSGEVLFPNAIAYDQDLDLENYIRRAGGYTQNAETSRVIIAHRDGNFDEAASSFFWWSGLSSGAIRPGDEILVLPKVDVKSRQIAKDLMQILYQIAISTKVILDL